MYSHPPATLFTLRESIAMMSIGDVKITALNGACGMICCFFEVKQGHSLSMKKLISFSMFGQ